MEGSFGEKTAMDRRLGEVSTGGASAGYYIAVGLLDCDSISISGADPRLEYAIEEQNGWNGWNGWNARTHAAYWTNLLPQLVKGRRPNADATSLAAALLEREGIPIDELHLAPGTIRQRVTPSRARPSGRPSIERGRDLLAAREAVSQGTGLSRLTGMEWDPDLALPRVWREGEDIEVTSESYFNPIIPEWARPLTDPTALKNAERALRAQWYQNHDPKD